MLRSLRATSALAFVVVLVGALLATGCGGDGGTAGSDGAKKGDETSRSSAEEASSGDAASKDVASRNGMYDAAPTEKLDPAKSYVVLLKTSKGDIRIAVDQEAGPIAAANFVWLVKQGFYDGTTFHRVIDGFMIQGGDPAGDGTGGPGYELEDDPVRGEYVRGTVAMANAGPDTGGSQFFIVQGEDVGLSKDYVIFGSVDDASLEVVDAIASAEVGPGPTGQPERPTEPITIERATLVE